MQKKAAQAAVVALLAHGAVQGAPLATGTSPDGSITVSVELDSDGRASYSVSRKGKLLIAPSKLGFILTGFRRHGPPWLLADDFSHGPLQLNPVHEL